MADDPSQHSSRNPPGDRPPMGASRVRSKDAADLAGGIEEMVREIRTRLTEISSRELELRRREQEFERQYTRLVHAARRTAEQEISADQEAVDRERRELRMRAEELAARRAQVESRASDLRGAVEEIERRRLQVALRAEEVDRRLQAQRQRHRRHRQALRQRIAVVRDRERELDRRLHLAHSATLLQREDLADLKRQLSAREEDLAALRQQLEQRETQLAEREAAVEPLRAELEAQAAELAATRDALGAAEAEVARQRTELAERQNEYDQRWQDVRGREQDLSQAAEDLESRRRALERYDEELRERDRQLAAREANLAGLRRNLEHRQAELAERETAVDERLRTDEAQAAEIEPLRAELEAQAAELAATRDALGAAEAEVARQQTELAERQREYDQRWRDAHERQQDLFHAAEDLEARRRALEQYAEELNEREARAARQEAQLNERLAVLQTERANLESWSETLAQRQAELERVENRLQAMELDALHLQQEAGKLHAAAHARDEKSRRAVRELDTERNALDTERAALEVQRAELERARDEVAARSATAERQRRQTEELVQQAQAQRAEQSRPDNAAAPAARPRYAALRGLLAALALGALAATATWLGQSPTHEAAVALEIATAGDDVAAAVRDHRAALLDPELLVGVDIPAESAAAWRQACLAGRVRATLLDPPPRPGSSAAEDPGGLRLYVRSRDAAEAERLARIASTTYSDRQNRVRPGDRIAPGQEWLRKQHAALTADLERARESLAEAQERLAGLRPPETLPAGGADVESTQAELSQTAALLEEARARVATLVATEPTRGTVDPAAIEEALRQDTIYVEDRNEFRTVALRYRTEIAVSALQMTDPIRTLAGTIAGCAETIQEQRQLEPPPEIAAALEDIATLLATASERVTEFREGWAPRVESIKDISIEGNEIVVLVERQNELANAARRLVDANAATVAALNERLATLDAKGEGTTRAVVVGAVLRGEQAELAAAAQAVREAAGKVSLADNFELDALDRQLRGLRVRLQQRRDWVTQQLQLAADRQVREAYAADVSTARGQVRTLEQERERLMTRLAHAIQELGRRHEQQRRWSEAAETVALQTARVEWLELRTGELSDSLRNARRRLVEPDRVSVGAVVTTSDTAARGGRAALAGAAAFALTWLACGLMFAGTKRRNSIET